MSTLNEACDTLTGGPRDVGGRARALEGRTLRTAGYGLPFVVIEIAEEHLVVEPETSGPRRLIARAGEMRETTPSYVIAILRALEEATP